MPESTSSTPGSGRRLAWADMAKALSIVLVVLHHTVGKHLGLVVPDALRGVEAVWVEVTYALKPVRMPLFFLVSGLFAGRALSRPWRDVARPRVANIYYLYAVWLIIHMAVFLVLDALPMNRTRNATELVVDLIYASTGLWYLYALVAYFVLARLLRGVDSRVVVAAAAGVALFAPALGIEAVNRVSLLQHFVYFVFGAHFPSGVGAMARLRGRTIVFLLGATVASFVTLLAAGAGTRTTRFVVSLLAVPLAVRGAAALAQWRPAASVGSFLGARTLPIYVLHVPVLAALHALLVSTVRFTGTDVAAVAMYPLTTTFLVVLVCLALHQLATRTGLGWLFTAPWQTTPRPADPPASSSRPPVLCTPTAPKVRSSTSR